MLGACANKGEQKTDANVNENPQEEKVEVKNVEGRKNFMHGEASADRNTSASTSLHIRQPRTSV